MSLPGGRRTARRAVHETLRQKVVTLELPPGSALSENELAASLGVSRTPVRESLLLLSEEGFVQVFPQVGSFVSRVDPQRVADAQFVREAVELASLAAVPDPPDADGVAALRENLEQQHRSGIDVEEFFRLDEEFHRGLLGLSGHARAWGTVASAKAHLDRARRLGLNETPPDAFVSQHQQILDALVAGDRTTAHDVLRSHLRAVFDDIEQVRARSPELFASDAGSVPVRRSVAVWT
ncbi:GntR family transcriptional regulator [Isoptericola sp. NPDC057391]|uniref:GntR family transcriptional regulator n=1 Tax=Isoptericola sp. NPDC057391 TaxID=3346117 RepID=UPI00363FDF32